MARVSSRTVPEAARRMKWLPLLTTIMCGIRWVWSGVSRPDDRLKHAQVFVLEHHVMVVGGCDRTVKILSGFGVDHSRPCYPVHDPQRDAAA